MYFGKITCFSIFAQVTVISILQSIARDPEDKVRLEDKKDCHLSSIEDLLKKGFRFRSEHWENKCFDMIDALQEVADKRLRYPYYEKHGGGSTSATQGNDSTSATPRNPPSTSASLDLILALLKEILEGQKDTNVRLLKIERKLEIYDEHANSNDKVKNINLI